MKKCGTKQTSNILKWLSFKKKQIFYKNSNRRKKNISNYKTMKHEYAPGAFAKRPIYSEKLSITKNIHSESISNDFKKRLKVFIRLLVFFCRKTRRKYQYFRTIQDIP